jgi:HK97 gp10 family phage protein
MPFKVGMKLEGTDALAARLRQVPAKLAKKHLKKAMNAVGSKVAKAAKARAGAFARTGQLKRSIGKKVKVYPSGTVVAVVGARLGFRVAAEKVRTRGKHKGETHYVNPVKYLRLVELGTVRSRARHFLRESLDANKSALESAVADAVEAAFKEIPGG